MSFVHMCIYVYMICIRTYLRMNLEIELLVWLDDHHNVENSHCTLSLYSVILGCSASYGCLGLGEGTLGVTESGIQPQEIFEVYFRGKLPRLH